MSMTRTSTVFSKLEHADEPYEPERGVVAADAGGVDGGGKESSGGAKLGFASCAARVSGESSLAARRFRDGLNKEMRFAKMAADKAAAVAAAAPAAVQSVGDGSRSMPSPALAPPATIAPTVGLRAALPRFSSDYDRSHHVSEFVPKVSYAVRYARDYSGGGCDMQPTSAAIGEGCAAPSALATPAHCVRDFTKAFRDRGHLMAPSVAGWST